MGKTAYPPPADSRLCFFYVSSLSYHATFLVKSSELEYTLLIRICCGKRKSTMSPLRKQGSRAKNWIPAFAGMTNTVSATGTNSMAVAEWSQVYIDDGRRHFHAAGRLPVCHHVFRPRHTAHTCRAVLLVRSHTSLGPQQKLKRWS